MTTRIKKIFSKNDKKLITFVTGCDPNYEFSKEILNTIVKGGADIIEIGMPFSDPMADGPTIQLSSLRAIKSGANLEQIFSICDFIRKKNNEIPIILMGYYNVIFNYGVKKFVDNCQNAGVDGLIIVDLQPDEDSELLLEMKNKNLDLIRLITPTTDSKRLNTILKHSSGFLYYVTITGITGQHSANIDDLKKSLNKIKNHTKLPIVAGFGIKNPSQVKEVCEITDGAVVGSSIVHIVENNLNDKNKILSEIYEFVKNLKKGTII